MASAKILFVEGENATVGSDLQSRIRRLGHSVLAVISLEKWIQGATEFRPEVVLLATGRHTDVGDAESIEVHHPPFTVLVARLVEDENAWTVRKAVHANPLCTLTEPFDDEKLATAIEMALHSHAIEKALRKNEKRYRFLAQNESDVIWTTDLDMRLTDGNPPMSQIVGDRVEEILGEKMTERLMSASREVAANALAELREAAVRPLHGSEETKTLILDFIRQHGGAVRTRAYARVVRDSSGEPTGILWVAQETAEPRRAERGNRERARTEEDQPREPSHRIRTGTALSETRRELEKTKAELARALYQRQCAEAKLDQLNRQWLCLQTSVAAIASSPDLDLVISTVTRELTELLEADGCAIFGWDQHTDTISLMVDHTSTTAATQREAGESYGLADHPVGSRTFLERRPQQVTVGKLDQQGIGSAYMQDGNIRSLLVLPMIYHGRLLGFVEMRDCQEERAFPDRKIQLAQMLTTQAASAIENARLYGQGQEQTTERVLVEKELRRSLREKEALLQEIHHRVKNNLQVISSLLNLRSESSKDPETRQMLRESRDRVRSMALIHEKLYQSEDLGEVDFGSYVRDLTNHLIHSYGTESAGVCLTATVDDVSLSIDKAVPCGLIINELVSNALKHAFPNGRAGEITVALRLRPDQHLTLSVADDGVGLPTDPDSDRGETLGLQLIRVLTDQIDGTVSLSSSEGNGVEVSIVFPAS